jgi:hypothetical protein
MRLKIPQCWFRQIIPPPFCTLHPPQTQHSFCSLSAAQETNVTPSIAHIDNLVLQICDYVLHSARSIFLEHSHKTWWWWSPCKFQTLGAWPDEWYTWQARSRPFLPKCKPKLRTPLLRGKPDIESFVVSPVILLHSSVNKL